MRHRIFLAVLFVMGAAGQVPDQVRLVVSSEKTDYYLGETVRLQLRFTSTEPNGFTANPNTYGRMGWQSVGDENGPEDFVVDPAAGIEDPIKGIFSLGAINVRCCAPPVILSETPFNIERILNDWVRFHRPGTYRLHVISHRVRRKSGAEQAATPIVLSSNPLTLVVHAAPPTWIKEQIAATTKVMDLPVTNPPKDPDARERAVQQLRFLNTPESAIELARRVDRRNYRDDWVLLDSSYRPQELAVLEGRLVAPDEACDGYLLDGLANLAQLISLGGMGWNLPKEEPARKAWQQEFQRRVVFRENKIREYANRLYAALPSKEPGARAECSLAVLGTAMYRQGRPEWLGPVTAEVRADFLRLRPDEQARLLQDGWPILRSPAMMTILRSLRETMPDLALPRIYELAPEEGRRLIIDEIRHRQHRIAFNTLAILPDRTLPELDDVLAAEYEQGLENADMLILRYASGAIANRVKETYGKRPGDRIPWGGPVVYYLLKYDPKFGEQELRRSLEAPAHYALPYRLSYYGPWIMSPALERLAIEFLSNSPAPVRTGAAQILGMYGSVRAKQPLWTAMETLRARWKGREKELDLAPAREDQELEVALVGALARASGWVMDEPELRKLGQLCSSGRATHDLENALWLAKAPISVRPSLGPSYSVGIGQYVVASDELLRRKLSQYPVGKTFWVQRAEDAYLVLQGEREQVVDAVRASGHRTVP